MAQERTEHRDQGHIGTDGVKADWKTEEHRSSRSDEARGESEREARGRSEHEERESQRGEHRDQGHIGTDGVKADWKSEEANGRRK